MSAQPGRGPVLHAIQHIGYIVEDVPSAVDRWVKIFGAGPFFWFAKNATVPGARYYGEPCVLEQSVAIGKWDDNFVELVQVHDVSPPELREAIVGNATDANRINHICYAVEQPDAEVERLEAAGIPRFWHASLGSFDVSYCDAWDSFGHVIEIHKLTPEFLAIFQAIAAGAEDWDGSDPLRELPH